MNWKSPQLHILGLDAKEKRILSALADPLSIQDLAKKCPIPRTTIAYITNKLIKRGFVEKVRIGKRHKYYSISEEKLKSLLESAHQMRDMAEPDQQKMKNKKVVRVQGLENVISMQADFLRSYRNERVYAIQPNKSWLSLHAKVDEDRAIHVNEIIRNNNLIIDAILEHDAYATFKKANRNKAKFAKLAKSFGNRMADYVFAPRGYLTDQVEMWLIADTVLFIDWREEVAIKLIDTHIAHFIKDMFALAKLHGRKIDHNESIRNILDQS